MQCTQIFHTHDQWSHSRSWSWCRRRGVSEYDWRREFITVTHFYDVAGSFQVFVSWIILNHLSRSVNIVFVFIIIIMDDLNGLFSSAPAPQAQSSSMMSGGTFQQPFVNNQAPIMGNSFQQQAPVMMQQQPAPMMQQQPPVMQQQPVMQQFQMQQSAPSLPITPTQTTEASQLNNKTQILNQFQSPAPMQAVTPPRPAPAIP